MFPKKTVLGSFPSSSLGTRSTKLCFDTRRHFLNHEKSPMAHRLEAYATLLYWALREMNCNTENHLEGLDLVSKNSLFRFGFLASMRIADCRIASNCLCA